MATIYDLAEVAAPPSIHVARASWTAIIHAVGAEASSTLIDFVPTARRLEPFCHHMIFLAPQGSEATVRPALESQMHGPFKLIIQREPRGTVDGLLFCRIAVKTPRIILVEAGRKGLTDEAMHACMIFAKQNPEAQVICPILETEQRESDGGLYFFKSGSLFRGLAESRAPSLRGVIAFLDKVPGDVFTMRIKESDLDSGAGVNP